MTPGIRFKKIWFDNDLIELKVDSCDGVSLFSSNVYVGYPELDELIEGLNRFKDQIYGGIFDLRFGGFGPEYANGAFQARFHFQSRGKIHITINAQSEFQAFGIKTVASEATLYLISEPALLDNFIGKLRALNKGSLDEIYLETASV